MISAAHHQRAAAHCKSGTQSSLPEASVQRDASECVGKWDMQIARGEDTSESERRWLERIDAITAWLMSEWEREHAEQAGESR